jgi:hypothetical protein
VDVLEGAKASNAAASLEQGRGRLRQLLEELPKNPDNPSFSQRRYTAANDKAPPSPMDSDEVPEDSDGEYLEISVATDLDKAVRQQVVAFDRLHAVCEKEEKESGADQAAFYDPLDYSSKQFDAPLADLDFVVESLEGMSFRGEPYRVTHGGALPRLCRKCRRDSSLGLLKNASEAETCILASRCFEGSLCTLCPSCLPTLPLADSSGIVAELLASLPEEDRGTAVILRLKDSVRYSSYRVVHWLGKRGIRHQVKTLHQRPYFLLKDLHEYQKLVRALEEESRGELVTPPASVCRPHYEDPLDEALSTQNGERTYMQTLEAQSFSRMVGLQKDLLTMLRERCPMHITNEHEEALVGQALPACARSAR